MYTPRLKLMFSHRSLQILLGLWLIGWIIVIRSGSWGMLWLVPLGFIGQMLNEYSMHRYLFHWPAPRRQFWFDLLYQAHYGHHDFPSHPALFFVPIWFAVPMALIHFCLAMLATYLLGFANPVAAGAAFTLIGGITTFLFYEWFHMTAHTNVKKHWLERHVTRLHGMHHFRDFTRWYHVNPGGQIIDRILGTAISNTQLKTQSRAEFLATLGLAPNDPRLMAARHRFAEKYSLSEKDIALASKT